MNLILNEGYIRTIDVTGSDERIIEIARMSTDGTFRDWDADEKLLRYLWETRHTTLFEMCGMSFEVQLPIFVIRQWQRHRTHCFNSQRPRKTTEVIARQASIRSGTVKLGLDAMRASEC